MLSGHGHADERSRIGRQNRSNGGGSQPASFCRREILAAELQPARWNTGDLAEATNPPAIGVATAVFRFAAPG